MAHRIMEEYSNSEGLEIILKKIGGIDLGKLEELKLVVVPRIGIRRLP
jgi:hypothetical protein